MCRQQPQIPAGDLLWSQIIGLILREGTFHANSLLVRWLLTCLALTIERLYRLRYLHRGNHRPRTAIELVRLLRFPAIFP